MTCCCDEMCWRREKVIAILLKLYTNRRVHEASQVLLPSFALRTFDCFYRSNCYTLLGSVSANDERNVPNFSGVFSFLQQGTSKKEKNVNNEMISQAELAENYPQPLSQLQRSRIEKQALNLMRQRKVLGQKISLLDSQLRGAEEALARARTRQSELATGIVASVVAGPVKRPREEGGSAGADESSSAAPPQRRVINLRKSAAFGALQSFLSSAVKESSEQLELIKRREDIAKQTQLAQLRTDIDDLDRTVESLEKQLASAREPYSKVDDQWRTFSSVLERLEAAESAYCSAFFLRAAGKDYDVFFTPAMHTEETKEIIAAQVEVALDEYLEYRSAVDPLLVELDEVVALPIYNSTNGGGAGHSVHTTNDFQASYSSTLGAEALLPLPAEHPLHAESEGTAARAAVEDVSTLLPKPFSELDDFED